MSPRRRAQPVVTVSAVTHAAGRRTELGVLLAVVGLVVALGVHSWALARPVHGDAHVAVTSAEFTAWPFTVPAGELGCDRADDDTAVTFETGGVVYAVNASAEHRHDGVDVRPVLDPAPGIPGLPAGVEEVVRRGLELCR